MWIYIRNSIIFLLCLAAYVLLLAETDTIIQLLADLDDRMTPVCPIIQEID